MGSPAGEPPPGRPYFTPPPEDDTSPPYGPWGAPLAGRWRRLFAGVVDGLIVGLITSPFSTTVAGRLPGGTLEVVHVWNSVAIAVVWFLYFWLLTTFWKGQTLGKKLFRMRVAQDPSQERVTPGQAAIRAAAFGIFSLACCLGLIDLAWILFDGKKQALHDKAASTLVVDA